MLKRPERLKGVFPQLQAVVTEAAKMVPFDVLVVEGLRPQERQNTLYAQGRTAPGKIITWTLKSKHIDGKAVDLAPMKSDGTIDWEGKEKFAQLASAMSVAGHTLSTKVRNGGDWDMDGIYGEKGETDFVHWELV